MINLVRNITYNAAIGPKFNFDSNSRRANLSSGYDQVCFTSKVENNKKDKVPFMGNNLIILSPPGAGKGTLANLIIKEFKLAHIEMSKLLKSGLDTTTKAGAEAKAMMDKGEFLSDNLVIGLLGERLNKADCAGGSILDGVPRTVKQAEVLDKMLADKNWTKTVILMVRGDMSEKEYIDRLTSRVVCSNIKCGKSFNTITMPPKKVGICDDCGSELMQRNDDKEEVIKNRLKLYEEQTPPIIDYYKKQGVPVTILKVSDGCEKQLEQLKKSGIEGLTKENKK